MKASELVKSLDRYSDELRAILSRFTDSHDSLLIKDSDQGKLSQITLELSDLLEDALGNNDYSPMIINAYNQGLDNYYESSSYASIERIVSIVAAVKTRAENNPALVERPKTTKSDRKALNLPDKVTLKWLFSHVPYTLWLWLGGLLIAAFSAGVTVAARFPVLQQWFGAAAAS